MIASVPSVSQWADSDDDEGPWDFPRAFSYVFRMSDFNPRPSDKLTASERKELDTSEFGIPQLREFPIHDAAHVRAAEAYFRYAPEEYKAQLARNILAKAYLLGVNVKSPTILEWAEK